MRVDKTHPTCNLISRDKFEYVFGGTLGDKNDRFLNHIITLQPIPENIGVTTVEKLTIAIDFELLFNSLLCDRPLFYRHDENGYPSLLTKDIVVSNEYDKKQLIQTTVKLGQTPREWLLQDWEDGNNNKIGGQPTWVQEPEYPNCPHCENKMEFLMHLNSDLPVSEPELLPDGRIYKDTIMFGSGGICYTYWCDKDRISGHLWQST